MSAQPRPRPRPRMRTATPTVSASASDPTIPSTSTSPPLNTDVYGMFNKNRAEDRRLRAQRAEEEARSTVVSQTIEISDGDDEVPSSPDGKRKRGQSSLRIKGTAKWTLKNPRALSPSHGRRGSTLAETDSESDTNRGSSDSEVRLVEDIHGKGKKRAKSRSPTPPPPLSQTHRKAILTIVKDHLESNTGTSSLVPDVSSATSKPVVSTAHKAKLDVEPGSAGAVAITVQWEPHPYDENAKSLPPETFEFHQHREQTLRQIFLRLTEKKHVFLEDLVVLKDGQPIAQATTALKLVGYSGQLHLSACEDNAYQVMLIERKAQAAAKAQAITEPEFPEVVVEASGEAKDEEGDVRRLAVSIRSAARPQPVTFRVKTTITCAGLLKRYVKDQGIVAKGNVRLQLDGEDLDGETTLATVLEDAGFDDDEEEVQLDVAGL